MIEKDAHTISCQWRRTAWKPMQLNIETSFFNCTDMR